MSSINLTIKLNQTGAVAHRVRYARIDNVTSPTYVTVSPDPVNTPNLTETIAENIPNGQYRIGYRQIYADGRLCDEQFIQTDPCPGLLSINAYIQGDNIIVQYTAPSNVPKVLITVDYPNGGQQVVDRVNDGSDIAIAIPTNLYGEFIVRGQSICDEETGFYSPYSTSVSVDRSPVAVSATLNFSFIKGTFNAFQAVLNTPISNPITINQMYSDGYSDAGCTIAVAASTRTTSVTINSGAVSTGAVTPTTTTGDWTTAVKYTMYNIIINGSPVNNGDVLTIGSDTVVVVIPSCV